MKQIIKNKKVFADYEVLDTYEAGVELQGWEVKSTRHGHISIRDSFVRIFEGQAWLSGVNISRWRTQSPSITIYPTRDRRLLLHKREIEKIVQKMKTKGITVVPVQVYISNANKIKVEIALVRGKKQYDKRSKLKEQDQIRDIERDLKNWNL